MFEHAAAGDQEAAIAAAAEAAAIGERFGDADLFALAAQDQGIMLIVRGEVAEGLALLDEAMVAVTAGELSPIVNGFVYCGVITGCQAAYEPRRAREWTAALTRWCEQQPDMVSFTGHCLVHRAEILQLHGDWREALEEARRARERCEAARTRRSPRRRCTARASCIACGGTSRRPKPRTATPAAAGTTPSRASRCCGWRRATSTAAGAAIRRLLAEPAGPVRRAGLLPAAVEILLAAGDLAAAHAACDELVGARRRAACSARWRTTRAGRSNWRRATHARRWSRCGGRRRHGLNSTPLRGGAEPRSGERGVPRGRRRRHGGAGAGRRRKRDVRAARRGAGPGSAWAPDEAHGLTARELQVLRLVASGAATARSRPRS